MEQQFKKRAKNVSSIGKYVPKYQKIDLSKQLLFVILDGIIYMFNHNPLQILLFKVM